jgi:hypothetical protein
VRYLFCRGGGVELAGCRRFFAAGFFCKLDVFTVELFYGLLVGMPAIIDDAYGLAVLIVCGCLRLSCMSFELFEEGWSVNMLFEPRLIAKLADELEKLEAFSGMELDYGVPYRTALDVVLGILKNPYLAWSELDVFEQHKFFSFLFEMNLEYDRKEGYRTPKYTVLKRVFEQIEVSGSEFVEKVGVEPTCSRGLV